MKKHGRLSIPANHRESTWFGQPSRKKLTAGFHSIACLFLVSACTFNVTTTVDRVDANPGDGICADAMGQCTLRAAVMEVHALSGSYRVAIPAGTYSLTLNRADGGGRLELSKNIRLQGAGRDITVIDAMGNSSVIGVVGGEPQIQSLTMTGGNNSVGGGMRAEDGEVFLTNVKFEGNTAFTGGAGLSVSAGASVEGDAVAFFNNEAEGLAGGAVVIWGSLVLRDSLMSNNKSNRAGAIHNNPTGMLNLSNVTVSGNEGTSTGTAVGGIVQNGFAELNNVTITGNEGSSSTGGGGLKTGDESFTVLRNSIVADNFRRSGNTKIPSDCVGTLGEGSRFNLIQNADNCLFPEDGTGFIIGVDAELATLSDNGGSTHTHRLFAGSPAIDAGAPDNAGLPASALCNSHDQRGVPRPQSVSVTAQDFECDLGAYEAGGLDAYVTGFLLVDGTSGEDIGPIRQGDVFVRSELPDNLSIRAVVSNPGRVGSIVFGYNDQTALRTDNSAPYSIAGDDASGFSPFIFDPLTRHDAYYQTISATPYAEDGASGSAGGRLVVTFNMVLD